tara:strand:+ start:186 stop:668 length:483 start_codon:yes stop_codon:yes gene_type:complete
MSTRNLTMVVDRSEAENNDLGFACSPDVVSDKSYVNMYLHHDGYPEFQGVQLARWIKYMQEDKGFNRFGDGSRIASHLVHDFHYNSQYLYPNVNSIDHQYTYIIWVGKSDVWITCWNQYTNNCIFVNKSEDVNRKWTHGNYKDSYTDWNEKYKLNTKQYG